MTTNPKISGEELRSHQQAFREDRAKRHLYSDVCVATGGAILHAFIACKSYLVQDQSDSVSLSAVSCLLYAATAATIQIPALQSPQSRTVIKVVLYIAAGVHYLWSSDGKHAGLLKYCQVEDYSVVHFWILQFVCSGVPWILVQTALFPFDSFAISSGVLSLAVAILIGGNPKRCQDILKSCPLAGKHYTEQANRLAQFLSLFTVRTRQFHYAQTSCEEVHGFIQLALGLGLGLLLSDTLRQAAQLHFARRSADVRFEWALERKKKTSLLIFLQFIAIAVVSWAWIDVYSSSRRHWPGGI